MRLTLALAVFVLAGCGQAAREYPADFEFNFMNACQAQGAAAALCTCAWDRIEANVPPAEFSALEQLPGPAREAHPLTEQINGYVMACAGELSADQPAEQAPAP